MHQGTAIRDRIQERLRGQQSRGFLENGKANADDDEEYYYYDEDDDEDEEYYDDDQYSENEVKK